LIAITPIERRFFIFLDDEQASTHFDGFVVKRPLAMATIDASRALKASSTRSATTNALFLMMDRIR